MNFSLSFLRAFPAALLTAVLVLEGAAFYVAPTAEYIPSPPALRTFAANLGDWNMIRESEIDAETQSFLKADDTMTRTYAGPPGIVNLFVGFFKSQRGGVTPHSPKICLPGNGWTPEGSRIISVAVPGLGVTIPVNRYVVRHGEDRTLVFYWYATAHHVMANEYFSKIMLMQEGLRHRRSDEAIFRVIAPLGSEGEGRSEATAISFIQAFYPTLKKQIWTE
jgi:EpsI family protein